ncbi:MAG: AMP-binding protein [Candidatus Omnitrophica bacterium]|nr:AMP-binding protein [Candidatus Omnitrophota bacterium]
MRKASLKNVTIIELLVAINRRFSKNTALQIKDDEGFRTISYTELGRRTSDTAYNLKKSGIEKGDRVAILSESRPEWSIAFFGIISCAGIVVPMDIKLSDAEIEFILNDSGAKCIFVSKKLLETILRIKPKLSQLQAIICLDDVSNEGVMLLKDFKVPENEIAYRDIQPDDTALIVYTSGTTGVAKGVEITYKNLLFEVMSLHKYIQFSPKDRFLSILPLNHLLELTGGLIAPLYAGACITYCDSLKPPVLMKLMQETKTTTMICVPLVLKMFHGGIMKKIEDMKPNKKKMFYRMLGISKFLLNFNVRIGKLLFKPLHREFGGHLKCFVSGGAPLDPVVEEDFHALGFNVLQGYGLTETAPVLTVNTFTERKYTSVGIPLKGVEIQIIKNQPGDREGEIIVRGPNVMRGYYKNKEKTDEVIKDDWFYSGDIGYLDDDGFLYITGRIKNMIVLGAGKKVFPEEIEEVMSKSALIKEMCVVGLKAMSGLKAGTEEVFAVIVPSIDVFSQEEKQNKDLIRSKISAEINRLSENLAEYKKISDFMLYFEELPKTSTKKIKRKEVLEKIVIPNQGGA